MNYTEQTTVLGNLQTPPVPPKPGGNAVKELRAVYKAVFVGAPGTGKTTVLRKILRKNLEAGRRALIVTPHEDEWLDIDLVHPKFPDRIRTYKGARRVIAYELDDIEAVCRNFKHGLLIFDDCKSYIPDTPHPMIRRMLAACRQNDVDFFAVGHGFTTVPPIFFTYATHFFIWHTTDNIQVRKNRIGNYALVEKAVRDVNESFVKDPTKYAHYYKIVKNL